MWRCKCSCEYKTECIVSGNNLIKKNTQSCGCLGKQRRKEASTTHGMTGTRLYSVWTSMKERCYSHKDKNYKNYGGRGIAICPEWKNDFMSFYNWAIDNGYDKNAPNRGCTIDRIDVNGNYEPSNCRWTDNKTQQNNRCNNHYITYKGTTKTLTQWSEDLGIDSDALKQRINVYNWSIERALETPVIRKNRKEKQHENKNINGK